MEYCSVGIRDELLIGTTTWMTQDNDGVRKKPGLGIDSGSGQWTLETGEDTVTPRMEAQVLAVSHGVCEF